LLYIRPLYLRADGGRIPELKQVIVAYANQIVMEATLDQALDRMFGTAAGSTPAGALPAGAVVASLDLPQPVATTATGGGDAPPLATQASDHYRLALQAQRDGNWALYGQEIEQLGEVLAQLNSGQ
jgi:uncharacterized membrane protein (UPF0182 family)